MRALIGLTVDPVYRANIAWYVAELFDAADLLVGFPLTEEIEPSPVFRP